MPELLLELFSEEIPARMQARAAEDLAALLHKDLAALMPERPRAYHGPRRLTVVGEMAASAETAGREERGPRTSAPEAALAGFLRKHGAAREALIEEAGFWVLRRPGERIEAAALVARVVPALLRGFPWPKSMRWGTSAFTWVRPLQRILCVLDGAVVPFTLAAGEDAVHGLASGDETEGHRIMAPGAFAARSFAAYEAGLRERRVVLDAAERATLIRDGIARLAAAEGLEVVPDEGLVAEVAGLVEWPVPLLGRIDAAFMDLPPEVMRTTMRVNQRYFALRRPDGGAAPFFGVVANIAASDGGAALVAGNERVLRARLSDARFFWDGDLKVGLENFLPKLDSVTYFEKLGTQGERVRRLERLARIIAPMVGADPDLTVRAAKLAKADLASGMVGEFPELQGVMGRYYALHGGEDSRVADAVAAHYRPLGPGDAAPTEPVSVAVALADKLEQLAGFFAVGERPTGSSDPYALRRAALGVVRIVRQGRLRVPSYEPVAEAVRYVAEDASIRAVEALRAGRFQGLTGDDSEPADWKLFREAVPAWLIDYDGTYSRVRSAFKEDWLPESWAKAFENELGPLRSLSAPLLRLLRREEYKALQSLPTRDIVSGAESLAESLPEFEAGEVKDYAEAVVWVQNFAGPKVGTDVLAFLADRLRVQLRAEGARHDVVAAVFGAAPDDDLVRLLARADALRGLIESEDGANLLTAYRRAANILRIEDRKDGPHAGPADPTLLQAPEEQALAAALALAEPAARARLAAEDFSGAMAALAGLRAPVDAFFDRVTVNDPAPQLRRNRLALLAQLRAAMDAVADLSKIEA